MKILLIITTIEYGGATNVILNLANGLKSRGHDITVGFGISSEHEKELVENGITCKQFKWLSRTNNPLSNFLFAKELRHFVLNEKFDIVHLHSSNTLIGALAIKIISKNPKLIFTMHGLSVLDNNYKILPYLKFFYFYYFKLFLYLVDEIVFVSAADLNLSLKKGITHKGRIIYNGLPQLNFLNRDEAKNFLGKMINFDFSSKLVFGSIGRLSYQKNFNFIIDNFKKILAKRPDIIFIIIGEGDMRQEFERQIVSLGLDQKVFLCGGVSNASQYIKAFDLFILPSRYEGLPVT
ncbi:MAG: glycosyltransferase, partial [Actinomycetota bacterium]